MISDVPVVRRRGEEVQDDDKKFCVELAVEETLRKDLRGAYFVVKERDKRESSGLLKMLGFTVP